MKNDDPCTPMMDILWSNGSVQRVCFSPPASARRCEEFCAEVTYWDPKAIENSSFWSESPLTPLGVEARSASGRYEKCAALESGPSESIRRSTRPRLPSSKRREMDSDQEMTRSAKRRATSNAISISTMSHPITKKRATSTPSSIASESSLLSPPSRELLLKDNTTDNTLANSPEEEVDTILKDIGTGVYGRLKANNIIAILQGLGEVSSYESLGDSKKQKDPGTI